MTMRLRELIKCVRMCKTAAEERSVIAKECSHIRTAIKEEKAKYRHRNVAKLLFIHMLGYRTHFGQMECLKLIVSNSYADKRMGYLGLMLLLDERQEVLMLVTNSLQTDLNHPNQYVVGLALCSLANISSPGIARDLAPNVVKLMSSSNPFIKKKAALCAIRTVRKVPELMEEFLPKVRPLLSERNHGVLITAVTLMVELSKMDAANIRVFRKSTPALVKILKSLVTSGYAPEHDVNGITDPFLQVATNTENTRNVGNAILYEAVQTIMAIKSEAGLRVLAVNVLGRFLSNKDNNIRYVALNTLRRVVTADYQAVQRHRTTIVECLRDHDVSIRRRALDMVYALINESNIKSLMRELLNYLMSTDFEARADLTAKICWATEKYAPNPRWYLDTILRVMAIAGEQIPEETVSNTIHLIIETPPLQTYAVHKLFTVLSKEILKQPLVQTGVWCLGEYADLLVDSGDGEIRWNDILELFSRILIHPSSTTITKACVLTALTKLPARIPDGTVTDSVLERMDVLKSNVELELQQRSCEYSVLLTTVDPDLRGRLLEKVPALGGEEDDEEDGVAPGEAPAEVPTSGGAAPRQPDAAPAPAAAASSGGGDLLGGLLSSTPAAAAPASGGGDLLSMLGGPSPAPVATAGGGGGGDLMSMLGGSSTPAAAPTPAPAAVAPAPAPAAAPAAAPASGGAIPTMTVFQKGPLTITFDFLKKPDDPSMTLITISSRNASPIAVQNFVYQAAVPGYIQMQMKPATGTVLPPGNSGAVTQQVMIKNTQHGQRPVVMKYRIEFIVNGNKVMEQGTVENFPPGV